MSFIIRTGRFLALLAVLGLSTMAAGCGGDSEGEDTGEAGSETAGGTDTP